MSFNKNHFKGIHIVLNFSHYFKNKFRGAIGKPTDAINNNHMEYSDYAYLYNQRQIIAITLTFK